MTDIDPTPTPEPAPGLVDATPEEGPRAELMRGADGAVRLRLSGAWRLVHGPPRLESLTAQLEAGPGVSTIALEASQVSDWDSTLPGYLSALERHCRARDIRLDRDGLPEGVQALLHLAAPGSLGPDRHPSPPRPWLTRVGQAAIDWGQAARAVLTFVGELVLALRALMRGRSRMRRAELWVITQEVGADALPIVSLISFLVGLILGYIGDQQLAQFGAGIFVADLVGLAVVIQMGALVTAIVLAGRTGAAFAAQLGTMESNEEIDALRTLGISPVDFLVLPRVIALVSMTPLLAVYADLMGIAGGAFAGVVVGGLALSEYLNQTVQAIGWNHIAQGLISATVYGAIVAISGCLRGLQCGRSAASVGQATTSAVVTAIVFIVIAAAVLTVVFEAVGL